jgi:hypothetical protein
MRRSALQGGVGLAAAALAWPAVRTAVYDGVSDFRWHARAAQAWAQTGDLQVPHFGFHALLVGLHALMPGVDWLTLAVVVAVAGVAALAVVVVVALGPHPAALTGAVALALVFASPVSLLSLSAHNLYHGYIGLAVYHNPTMLVLKPLAVAVWLAGVRALDGGAWPAAAVAALSISATLVKPSLALPLVPALLISMLLLRRAPGADLRGVALGIVIPTCAVLAWQFAFRYVVGAGQEAQASIELAPLRVMRWKDASVPARFLLSTLFAVTVAACFPRQVASRADTRLAWLVFGFGAALAYMLAEGGELASQANFVWSAQIGLLLLFVASARVVLDQRREEAAFGWRGAVCAAALGLHVLSGAAFWWRPTWW